MTSILDVLANHGDGGHLSITKILLFVVLLFFVTFPDKFLNRRAKHILLNVKEFTRKKKY
jgi:hypothetical protein